MILKLKTILIPVILLFSFLTYANSEEKYCLDNNGLMLPLFDENSCMDSDDLELSQDEFTLLIEIEPKERRAKLNYYKENLSEIKQTNDENKSLANLKDKKELTTQEKKKIENKQKKLAKLAKELEKKELIKANKEKRILEHKKRQAEIRKKAELRKKELKEKKLKRTAEKKKRELEKKQKIAAKKKEAENQRLKNLAEKQNKLKEKKLANNLTEDKKEKLATTDKVNLEKSINNDLKILLIDNKIVNSELFPNINGNLEIVDKAEISKEFLDSLTEFNKNILVLIPKDFETSSVRVSENRMLSQIVIGIDQIPNPEINRIEAELRSAERDYLIAERNFQIGTSSATNYDPYGGWASVINQWAGLAQQTQAGKQRDDAKRRFEHWSQKLSSTPMYLEKERMGSYNYDVVSIKSEKKSVYDVLSYNNDNFFYKNLDINETKTFQIAYGLNPQDKKYNTLSKKYSNEQELSKWSNSKINDLSVESLKTKIQTSEEFSKLESKRIAYKYLGQDIKEQSFWSNLFSFNNDKNKGKQTASLTNQSSYETKDERFESVVVVKTGSGMGSGFFISDDEIITNYHVVEGAMSISIIDKNNNKSSAVVVKKDLKRDLALLKTNMTGKPVNFYNGQLKQGEMVEALGHPKGRKFSLTKGWISAIRKESSTYSMSDSGDVLFIQTDAAINPGNSGGPLFYKDKVVGVNTQGLHKDVSEGMNFAVHFSEVNKFLSN